MFLTCTAGPSGPGHGRLDLLEALRGIAAVWVLLHHGELATSAFLGEIESPLISNGYLGVDFFFVLSGFIIAHSSRRLADAGRGLRDYLSARIIRIYVPYLPVGLALYFAYILLPGFSAAERSPGLLTTVALLPSPNPPALSVAWTLVHEMLFYAVFSLWFVSRRLLVAALLLWGAAIVASHFAGFEPGRTAQYLLSPLNLCFLLGVAVSTVRVRSPLPVFALGALAVILQASSPAPDRLWVAIGFGLVVLACASAPGARVWRWLVTLGAASYAIYLVHDPVLSLAARLARIAETDGWLGFGLICAAALAAGLAYWWVYERHALRWARTALAAAGDLRSARRGRLPHPLDGRSQDHA